MTVVLAVRCANGIVLASDSQITDPGRGLSYPAQKLHALGNHAAWGGSGSRAVLYDIEQIFNDEADAVVEAKNLGHALQSRVLPVLKHHGFGRAVNVTLGLPIIRTSVDHGTALDLAGTGRADAGSLREAVKLAIEMAARQRS